RSMGTTLARNGSGTGIAQLYLAVQRRHARRPLIVEFNPDEGAGTAAFERDLVVLPGAIEADRQGGERSTVRVLGRQRDPGSAGAAAETAGGDLQSRLLAGNKSHPLPHQREMIGLIALGDPVQIVGIRSIAVRNQALGAGNRLPGEASDPGELQIAVAEISGARG